MSLTDSAYWVPEKSGKGRLNTQQSRFWAFAFPVESADEAKAHLKSLRAEYYDATHVCYAWILGSRSEDKMAADAGEPAHSAGTPILNAIRAAELTNVLVAVVRYYGGTKLGVPGLIAAYGEAARLALEDAGRREKIPEFTIRLEFEYTHTSAVEKFMHHHNSRIITQSFQDHCTLHLAFPEKHKDKILADLERLAPQLILWKQGF